MGKIIIFRFARGGKRYNMKKLQQFVNQYIEPEHEKDIITKLKKEQDEKIT